MTVKSLHSFYNTPDPSGSFASAEGGHPRASLLEGADGKLYGTTWTNGPNMTAECDDNDATCPGTIFSLTRSGGSFTVLHAFSALGAHGRNADGYQPVASLVQDSSGYLYGTTAYGGQPGAGPTVQGAGVMFRILPNGTGFEPLYSFCSSSQCADGSVPQGALIQHGDGFFYGATTAGSSTGQGVIYKLATDGSSLTTLHTFSARTDGTNSDGAVPYGSPIFADSSHLWGFTLWGGKYAKGTIYSLASDGSSFTTLHDFKGQYNPNIDHAPLSNLIKGSDGNFYGVTLPGCQYLDSNCEVPPGTDPPDGTGIVFKITPSGAYQALHEFSSISDSTCPRFKNDDGAYPLGTLVEGQDGNLYGTTQLGGANGKGGIFQITKDGSTFVLLYSFSDLVNGVNAEGAAPSTGLIQSANDSAFYGTAFAGGAHEFGTVYRMTPPLTFPSLENRALNTLYTSDEIRLAAIGNSSSGSFTISNGEYSLNGGAFTTAPTTVHTGNTLRIRTTSASTYSTRVLASYTIGNRSGAFAVTTMAAP